MPTLQLPVSEGRLEQASLSSYAQWAHGHPFVDSIAETRAFSQRHLALFRSWAFSVGLLLEEQFLPHLQTSPLPPKQGM